MAVKEWPLDICPANEQWAIEYNTQTFTSDLNGVTQTAELPGAMWTAQLTFNNKRGTQARKFAAFLASLHGQAGRFYLTPTDWQPNGTPEGSGVVAADTPSGSTIPTSGWNSGIAKLLVEGDYFEINGELKIVTATASSDSSGDADISFSPPLRKPVTAGMSIRVDRPRCVMLLSSDDQASWSVTAPILYASTISAREALDL